MRVSVRGAFKAPWGGMHKERPSGGATATDLVRGLCEDAARRLHGEPATVVRRLGRELAEPQLRIATMGRVSSGKSALVNALLGRRVAPTDAGECTRFITSYGYGNEPSA